MGIGGRFNHEWYLAQWQENFIEQNKPSIQYVELLGLCIAVFIWAPKLANKRVIVFVDNTAVQEMVNQTSTGGLNCMILIRKLELKMLEYNFRLFARHIESENNQVVTVSAEWTLGGSSY